MKRLKMVYFVTLVIKYTKTSSVGGSSMKMNTQSITIYQKIQKKSKDATDAYNQTILEAQTKYQQMSLIAYTTTELEESIFEIEEVKEVKEINEEKNGGESC